jgi:hypothetical protein
MTSQQWAHPSLELEALLTYSEATFSDQTHAAVTMLRSEGRDFGAYACFEKVALPACRALGGAVPRRPQSAL